MGLDIVSNLVEDLGMQFFKCLRTYNSKPLKHLNFELKDDQMDDLTLKAWWIWVNCALCVYSLQ